VNEVQTIDERVIGKGPVDSSANYLRVLELCQLIRRQHPTIVATTFETTSYFVDQGN
jgi:hypothetical protein